MTSKGRRVLLAFKDQLQKNLIARMYYLKNIFMTLSSDNESDYNSDMSNEEDFNEMDINEMALSKSKVTNKEDYIKYLNSVGSPLAGVESNLEENFTRDKFSESKSEYHKNMKNKYRVPQT
eukprot:CAMPEP_0205800638 /NCGR_PEP_ID=MMETSP0205-20121125/2358_1 /ASSEMBLY_ACC=CAM_ASM_000278 /TAXON_ID=36767 /ORGANISM="Euplotes focardii, Strain TN1" /LENGTH=120 /DNA_ID=CAMNT_0053064049 /DNA_START=62 /DNA_END=424 /DNA_ORIENTATION=+